MGVLALITVKLETTTEYLKDLNFREQNKIRQCLHLPVLLPHTAPPLSSWRNAWFVADIGQDAFLSCFIPPMKNRNYLALRAVKGTKSIKTQVKTQRNLCLQRQTFSLQNIHCTLSLRELIKGSHSLCDTQGGPDGWAQLDNFPTQQIIWDLAISAISFHIKYLIRINRGCSFVLNKASQYIHI